MGVDDELLPVDDQRTGWRSITLVLIALLGAGVLFALITTLSEANRQRDRALSLQSHSFQVMILARTLSTTMARAEASLGRYVISANTNLGQIYAEEWSQAGNQIDQLEKLTFDNVAQRHRIAQLRAAYLARGDELATIALSTRYHKNDQALARYYQARQSPALLRINSLVEELVDSERALLNDRTGVAMSSVARQGEVARILGGFGVLIVLGAIALGWLTVQALGQRSIARAEAEAERERAHDLERAVAAATAELKQEAAERIAAEEQLRQVQKMEAVGQLTGGIAHDFNNMLAVVLGGLELARRHIADEAPAARFIDRAAEGANRAVALTRRLLVFSRAEALLPAAIDPGELIAGMGDLLDRTLGDAIEVTIRNDSAAYLIWADRHQLENALLNLAVNARDAMEGRGTLAIATGQAILRAGEVGACPAGDYVTISVTDTGAGMTPEVLDRVFEPFFTTKPVGKGTGLGLSQIFGFVRESNGEITIDSVPGKGTTVTLYLPRFRADTATAENPDIARPAGTQASTDATITLPQSSLDILVIEDDSRVLTATAGALEELGHRAITCGDPLIAGQILSTNGPVDLIVSDVLMPGKTGPEVVAELRAAHPDVAVLFVTGFAGEAGGLAEFGNHVVLRKPFTIAALQRAIDDAMVAQRQSASTPIAAE